MIRRLTMLLALLITGCAGRLDYVRPVTQPASENSKVIDKPREAVWKAAVPALGKQFFVINNLDQSSGLINLSYSGDPEAYVDCGRVVSYVKNLRGARTYEFAGAKADQSYEAMESSGLYAIQRKMSLEGRVNVVFEELGPDKTRVTVNTRYVLTRTTFVREVGGGNQNRTDSISFNSGSGASFPAASNGRAIECVPTGKLERDILALIN